MVWRSARISFDAEAPKRWRRDVGSGIVGSGVQTFAAACPDQPASRWDLLRTALDDGFQSIDRGLKEESSSNPGVWAWGLG